MDKRAAYLVLFWTAAAIGLLALDYATGPSVQFPVGFTIPVFLASWYSGRAWGLAFAVVLSIARLFLNGLWGASPFTANAEINFAVRLTALSGLALLAGHAAALSREVKVLRGILPTCSGCKRIRTEDGSWVPMEAYISDRSEALFSHGLCSDCAARLYPGLADRIGSSLRPPAKHTGMEDPR